MELKNYTITSRLICSKKISPTNRLIIPLSRITLSREPRA